MRKVQVIPYQENWSTLFQLEKDRLQKILESELYEIHHIGSTSVEGMCAKPVIDIIVTVGQIEYVDGYVNQFLEMGYEAMGENGISGRRFFIKGGNNRTHHVHIYQKDSNEINRHLAFRDYLQAFPEEKLVYSRLKLKLAELHSMDIEEYIKGKQDYIQEVEKKAIHWFDNMKIIYREDARITRAQLVYLYNDVGWTAYTKNTETLQLGLANSLYHVSAWLKGELVGLVRIVGDGETIIYIQDLLVLQSHQRKGIASALMEKVLVRFKKVRQKVLLTNDSKDVRRFYEKHKFISCDQGNLVAFARLES